MSALFPEIIVNGETIPSAAIAAEAQNHNAASDKPGHAWRAAAQALAIRTLLLQESAKQGFEPDPQEIAEDKIETDEDSLIRQVAEQKIEAGEVTDAECLAAYEARPEFFQSPSLFQPAHILIMAKPDDPVARVQAKEAADTVLAKVLDNPKKFADLAKEYSACQSKDNGGQLGQVSAGETVPEFEEVMDVLGEGEIHPELVSTRFGFHIIRMDKKSAGQQLPYETVKGQIREKLEQVAWVKAANAYTKNLVDNADIEGIDLSKPLSEVA